MSMILRWDSDGSKPEKSVGGRPAKGSTTVCLNPRSKPLYSSEFTTRLGQLQGKEVIAVGRTMFESRFRGYFKILICTMYIWGPEVNLR